MKCRTVKLLISIFVFSILTVEAGFVGNDPVNHYDYLGLACDIVVKRVDANLKATKENKRYGHEWMVIGSTDSYGWWPQGSASGNMIRDVIFGVPGQINRGNPNDPYHPYVMQIGDITWETKLDNKKWLVFDRRLQAGAKKGTKCKCASCSDIDDCVKDFAGNYAGKWSLLRSCRTFSKEALDACCLTKGKKTIIEKTFTGGTP